MTNLNLASITSTLGHAPSNRMQQKRKITQLHISCLSAICWCTLLLAGTAVAQSSEWKRLNQEVLTLYRQGKYDQAAVVATKVLKIAERDRGPVHPDVSTALNNLGKIYTAQGQYAAAEPLYKRSLAISEKALCRS